MVDKKEKCCHHQSPFVAIPASLGGILLVIVFIMLMFAVETITYLPHLVWGFVVLGFFGLLFAYLSEKKK